MSTSIYTVLKENLPLFAPLSEPLVFHSFEFYLKKAIVDYIMKKKDMTQSLESIRAYIWRKYMKDNTDIVGNGFGQFEADVFHRFYREVDVVRQSVWTYMQPFVTTGKIESSSNFSTEWFMQALQMSDPQKQLISLQTLAQWKSKNLLKNQSHKYLDLDSVASILIVRMLDTRERGWLPQSIGEDEPRWWCWRASSDKEGRQCMIAYPVPLPPDELPKTTILCTPWRGAVWKNEWLDLDLAIGAARWGQIQEPNAQRGKRLYWELSPQELVTSSWGIERLKYEDLAKYDGREEKRHDLLCLCLRDIAEECLVKAEQSYMHSISPEIGMPQVISQGRGRPSKLGSKVRVSTNV